ncbi:MAG: hypothetical protein ISS26_00125 [Candidatus Omnitrophica bacterium]|nr:hypothetical protein [Candidatus Omnitrophota bacterium]
MLVVLSVSIFAVCLAVGFFLLLRPELVIEMQRRFYALINWRMEPISMEKEIRNTRIMGGALIVPTLVVIVLFIVANV